MKQLCSASGKRSNVHELYKPRYEFTSQRNRKDHPIFDIHPILDGIENVSKPGLGCKLAPLKVPLGNEEWGFATASPRAGGKTQRRLAGSVQKKLDEVSGTFIAAGSPKEILEELRQTAITHFGPDAHYALMAAFIAKKRLAWEQLPASFSDCCQTFVQMNAEKIFGKLASIGFRENKHTARYELISEDGSVSAWVDRTWPISLKCSKGVSIRQEIRDQIEMIMDIVKLNPKENGLPKFVERINGSKDPKGEIRYLAMCDFANFFHYWLDWSYGRKTKEAVAWQSKSMRVDGATIELVKRIRPVADALVSEGDKIIRLARQQAKDNASALRLMKSL